MKTQHVFRILSVLLMVFMTLATARPAYADTLVKEVYPMDYSFDWIVGDPVNPSPCDFDIHVHTDYVLRVNYWLDEYNRPTTEIDVYANFKSDWSANGKTVDIRGAGPALHSVEYYTDKIILTVKVVGAYDLVTVPGYGIIRGGGGQIFNTLTFTPDWEFISWSPNKYVGNFNWDWGPICTYLRP